MNAPDFKAMGDPLNDRLPPRRRKSAPPHLTLPCEGSSLVGHPQWRGDVLRGGVMCQMCGGWFTPVQGTHDGVPDHRRPDILAMLERGDYTS